MKKTVYNSCTIEAPCKINLHLAIGEKQPSGFHGLESIFVSLNLGDTLRFETGPENGVQRAVRPELGSSQLFTSWDVPEEVIPPGKNLVLRAISLFREQTGYKNRLNAHLYKRIPLGSGLGGGSSDAASTLLALNSLAQTAIPKEELVKMAAALGSDAPFFISGGAAFVSGRGDVIEKIGFPGKLWVVLVKPPFASDTSSAFRLLDEARENGFIENPASKRLPKKTLLSALEHDPRSWPFYNDFLPLFLMGGDAESCKKAGIYRDIQGALKDAGASFTGLSGSGSCYYGVFTAMEKARKAEKVLSGEGNAVRLTFFLAQRPDPVLQ